MATEYVSFRGKAMWPRLNVPDDAFNALAWRVKFYFANSEESKRFTELGVKNRLNRDAEGDYANLKRDVTKLSRGRTITFSPPVVVDKDGNPYNGDVPNGTDIECTLEYYTYAEPGGKGAQGKAIRLHKVQLLQ